MAREQAPRSSFSASSGSRRPDPVQPLALGWAIRWFGLSAYAPFALIYLNVTLGLPYEIAGAVLALPNIAGLVFPMLGGGLTDRFGRRRVLVVSFAIESLGLAILAVGAFDSVLPIIVSALFVTRASGTLGNPSAIAYVTDLTDLAHRAGSQAWMRTALNAGFTVGTLAGGISLSVFSFADLAALSAAVTAAGVVITVVLVPPSPYDQKLASIGREDSVAHPTKTPREKAGTRIAASFSASLTALRRDKTLLLIWAAACATWTLNQQISYAVPAYAHTGLGLSFAWVGIALALNTVIVVVLQLPLTRIIAGRSMILTGTVGTVAYALAFLVLGIDGILGFQVLSVLFGSVVLLTIGECAVFYPTSTLSMNLAPKDARGAYSGAMQTSAGVGTVLAPLTAGLAFEGTANPLAAWSILALPAIPAVTLLLLARRRVPSELDMC